MTIASTGNLHQELSSYLSALEKAIHCQHIQTESDLEASFRVTTDKEKHLAKDFGYSLISEHKGLLDILGYSEATVDDHCAKTTFIGEIPYIPDYVLKYGQKSLAVVDLKAPGQNLDNLRWITQILSYCQQQNAPLGLLFNGTEARVFVNTSYKRLTKHKKLFEMQPIAAVSTQEKRRLTDVLLKFAIATLADDPIKIANDLASKRRHELRDRARQKEIQKQLTAMLSQPSQPVFDVLATIENWGTSLEPKPSAAELRQAWGALQSVKANVKP